MITIMKFIFIALSSFLFSGCTMVGNTNTVESYYDNIKNEIFFLQSDIDLPVVEEKIVAAEQYNYTDPYKSDTPLYDTKEYEGKIISKYFTVSDFNTVGEDTFRYARVDENLLECLVKLHEAIGPFDITAYYIPQDYNLTSFQHNEDSLRFHSSGKAVDITPPCSVALLARKVYELCGCNIGIGVNDKWLHIELQDKIVEPWKENNKRRSLYSRISRVHSAYCVSKKITEDKSYYSKIKKKYFSDSSEETTTPENNP